ncbi:MAG: alpha/beta hydrolase fold protein [Bryobacterales bacterium]|nr:alpha/beta hydrolase fold protein [Bryobacterales bacterium]
MKIALLTALGVLPFAAGWLYQAIGSIRDAGRFPPPGRVIGGLHITEQGSGSPAVVLESGIAGSSLSWKRVEDEAARFSRVLSYDRAGLGWSSPATSPRTLAGMVEELRSLLRAANVAPPYILVGHSFGGLIVRYFAAKYPNEVGGILLVDVVPVADWFPLSASQRRKLARGVKLSRRGADLARFGVVRFALARLLSGSRTLPRLLAKFMAGNGASVADGLTREVRKLPPELWPMVQAHWCQPKCFTAMADYLQALPANAKAAARLGIPESVPAIALCSDYNTTEPLSGVSYRRVEACGHWIQLDRPELVAEAIRDLLDINRRQSPVDPEG